MSSTPREELDATEEMSLTPREELDTTEETGGELDTARETNTTRLGKMTTSLGTEENVRTHRKTSSGMGSVGLGHPWTRIDHRQWWSGSLARIPRTLRDGDSGSPVAVRHAKIQQDEPDGVAAQTQSHRSDGSWKETPPSGTDNSRWDDAQTQTQPGGESGMEKTPGGEGTAVLLGEGGLDCVGWDGMEQDGGTIDADELAITEPTTGGDFSLGSSTGGEVLSDFQDSDTAQSGLEHFLVGNQKIKATPLKVRKLHQSRPLSEAPPETILLWFTDSGITISPAPRISGKLVYQPSVARLCGVHHDLARWLAFA